MNEEVDMIMEMAEDQMKKAISHFENELTKIRAGKATPSMLDSVYVDYYGANTPLNQAANVNTLDAKTITVQPWDKSMLEAIEKGIMVANLGLNPQNNGEMIIISVPPLTEERRRDLVKKAKAEAENARVSIRSARREANESIKDLEKQGLPEDAAKSSEEEIQKLTNNYNAKVDRLLEAKEKDMMAV